MDTLTLSDTYSLTDVSNIDGLPTPPFSPPQTLDDEPRPNTSVVLLNSLVSFYQQESLWVHRTRAALELALTSQGRDSITAAAEAKAIAGSPVKHEPPSSPSPLNKRNTRWMQRKKSFNMNLKLDPIAPSVLARRRRRRGAAPAPEAGTRLLELFGQLMESRMESCNRVSRLVQEANRADLYSR
ncbi:hypothetical protein OF83DRAFT_1161202 [Amylostereum chailletii]|nr:hypothetical protein OF83DRAFT_1161202 [Amylostereum chailletii]